MNRNSPAISEEWNITSCYTKDDFLSEEMFFVPMHQNIRGVRSTGCTVTSRHTLYGDSGTLVRSNVSYLFCLFLNNQIQKTYFLRVNM
jgi:hypothetical protein